MFRMKQEDRDRIIDMARIGKPVTEIVAETKHSYSGVKNLLVLHQYDTDEDLGITVMDGMPLYRQRQIRAEIHRLLSIGEMAPNRVLAKRLSCSHSMVYKARMKYEKGLLNSDGTIKRQESYYKRNEVGNVRG